MEPSNTAVPKYYEEFRGKVESGEIIVNEKIAKQMSRIEFLIDSPDYYFDNDAVDGWIDFCEGELCRPDGDDLTLLWSQKLWAEDALGWFTQTEIEDWVPYKHQPGGKFQKRIVYKRLVTSQYLIVGRGSLKTVYAECHQSHRLVIDSSTCQQLVLAPTESQANETITPIGTAITRAKGPLFKFMTQGSRKASNSRGAHCMLAATSDGIHNYATNSTIKYCPMTIDRVQGYRGDMVSLDEWLSTPIRENVINALEQGMSKNPEYFLLATSSEGTVRNGPGDDIKLRLQDILDGKIFDPSVSIWWYGLDDISEVADRDMWQKAMPTIGIAPLYSAVEKDVLAAESDSTVRNDVLAKRFGIPTEGISYYFDYNETLPQGYTNYDGLRCAMGCDFSRGDDFCTVLFLFPYGDRFGVDTLSFVTRYNVNKLDDALYNKYQEFIREGSLIIQEKPVIDMDLVFESVMNYIDQHNYGVMATGYDLYNAEQFIKQWEQFHPYCNTSRVVQGPLTETVPLGDIKALARDRNLIFHQSIMQFTMGNACVWEDTNGNRKLYKKNRESKIDCVSALIDAYVAYTRAREQFR